MARNIYEPLKTYFLKVNINCDGCKRRVKKTLRKVEGVYSVDIDTEQQAVMVRGNLDPEILVKKLKRRGKHAELLFFSPNHKDQFGNIQDHDNRRSNISWKNNINITPSYERHNLNHHQSDEEMMMMMMGDADYFQMSNSAELFGGNNYQEEEVHPNLVLGYSNATGSMNMQIDDDMILRGPSLAPQHQQFSSRPFDGFYY